MGHLVNIRDKTGRTPLMLMCRNVADDNMLKQIEALVDSGCRGTHSRPEIIGVADNHGKTALHHLLESNVLEHCKDPDSLSEVLTYLMRNGIDAAEAKDEHDLNAVILSIKCRYPENIVRCVMHEVKYAPQLVYKDAEGKGALEWCEHWMKLSDWRKWAEMVKKLLKERGYPKILSIPLTHCGLDGNVIPFTDTSFDPPFDFAAEQDRVFMSRLQELVDESAPPPEIVEDPFWDPDEEILMI